jgi:hypothetical protein
MSELYRHDDRRDILSALNRVYYYGKFKQLDADNWLLRL